MSFQIRFVYASRQPGQVIGLETLPGADFESAKAWAESEFKVNRALAETIAPRGAMPEAVEVLNGNRVVWRWPERAIQRKRGAG